MTADPNDAIKILVDRWCDRREYGPLAWVLPAWISNSGLTDGWVELRDALRTTYGACRDLPPEERDELKRIVVQIDVALQNQ